MTPEFNGWWDSDLLSTNNPYREDSPAYWAWEGWRAGVKAEREECVKLCDGWTSADGDRCAEAIRARGEW